MSNQSLHSKTTTTRLSLVSGVSGGHEVFLGKAIDEPYEGGLTLEGKILSFTPQGVLIARPFTTITTFPLNDPRVCVQHISHPRAIEEATRVLEASIPSLSRFAFPLLHRWIESACSSALAFRPGSNGFTLGTGTSIPISERIGIPTGNSASHPLYGLFQGFLTTAEQFRRVLFHARQVSTPRELDRLAELEGNLTIEIGKIGNQIAIKFHQLVMRQDDAFTGIDGPQGIDPILAPVHPTMAGWTFLFERLHNAKAHARRAGNVALVRDLNGLIKDGIFGLNEVILEHCNTLDTLIAETFNQYGISYEIHGDLSPFTSYAVPTPTVFDRDAIGTLVGSSS